MSNEVKRQYLERVRLRYLKSNKRQKSLILDEFCEVCAINRKHAIKLMHEVIRDTPPRPGPKPAQNIHPRRHKSSVTGRTSRHESYQVSQSKRKRIEEIFGWLKTIGPMRRPMFRGKERMEWAFCFSASVYNLVRMSNLLPA